MICLKCGKEIADDSKVCILCGNEFSEKINNKEKINNSTFPPVKLV